MTRMLENVALEKLKRIGKTIAFVFLSRRDTYYICRENNESELFPLNSRNFE